MLAELKERFKECHLKLHQKKTKIVYCKDGRRKGMYDQTEFTFLGYTFRRRTVKSKKEGLLFLGFVPAVSLQAQKSMRASVRKRGIRNRTNLSLVDIANIYNPILRGWMNYYGRYSPSSLHPVLKQFNKTLVKWMMHKYKRLRRNRTKARALLQEIAARQPHLFVHWQVGVA